MLRPANTNDAAAIASIYNHYVLNTAISFEEQAVAVDEMASRMAEVQQAGLPWLVLEVDNQLIGYAYASKWKGRCAYRFSVESTVYLAATMAGKGHGTILYAALLDQIKAAGMHVAIGGIAQPNEASVALHEKLGFTKVAHFAEVGFKFGQWRDVGYWQITF